MWGKQMIFPLAARIFKGPRFFKVFFIKRLFMIINKLNQKSRNFIPDKILDSFDAAVLFLNENLNVLYLNEKAKYDGFYNVEVFSLDCFGVDLAVLKEKIICAAINKKEEIFFDGDVYVKDLKKHYRLSVSSYLDIYDKFRAVFVFKDKTMGLEIIEKYKKVYKYIEEMIIISDKYGRIIDANYSALDCYGYEDKELYDLKITDLIFFDFSSVKSDFETFESWAIKKDKSQFYIKGQIVFINDILLCVHKKALEEKEKHMILTNLNHELRTPLNGLMGLLDITLMEYLKEEQRYNLNCAKKCAKTLLDTVNSLLDYAKIKVNLLKVQNEKFDFKEFVFDAIKPYEFWAHEKNLVFVFTYDENIPKFLVGDKKKIHEIICQLLDNAIKFTDEGFIDFSVFLEDVNRDEAEIFFMVKDSGIGMGSNILDRIFDGFYQGDMSFTKKYSGLGLGLYIAKNFAKKLNGRIWVNSIENEGSAFFFKLKLKIG